MKLFIVVNVDWFFLSHRLPVALAAQKNGWEVTIVTADTGRLKEIEAAGLRALSLPMSRSGMNPFHELRALWFLILLYRREKPDVVHHVALKAILWGGIAARLTKVHGVVNAVAGLGSLFTEQSRIVSTLLLKAFRFSHHRSNLLVIFQNDEDRIFFVNHQIIGESKARMIRGSGIDLRVFDYRPEPESGKIIILQTPRMIKEKGVFVLIEAAEILRDKYESKVEFWIAGGLDDHRGAITIKELEEAVDGKYIKWLGKRDDVKEILQNCHIFAYPSYYREGIPMSLIEAAAIGRPIVTTDHIGCKEVVVDGENGYLVPIKDSQTLSLRIKELIDSRQLRTQMGLESRKKAERDFSIDYVIEHHLSIYKELL